MFIYIYIYIYIIVTLIEATQLDPIPSSYLLNVNS